MSEPKVCWNQIQRGCQFIKNKFKKPKNPLIKKKKKKKLQGAQNSENNVAKEEQSWRTFTSRFQIFISSQVSVVLLLG